MGNFNEHHWGSSVSVIIFVSSERAGRLLECKWADRLVELRDPTTELFLLHAHLRQAPCSKIDSKVPHLPMSGAGRFQAR